MTRVRRLYHVLRLLGPRFVVRRARLVADHALGITRRRFAARPWESIALRDIVRPGVPVAVGEYAKFKSENAPPFLFPLGEPPNPRRHGFSHAGMRTPSLEERLGLLTEGRCVYFFQTPSPVPIDWHYNPFGDFHAPSDEVWCDIPDFSPTSGDARTMWEPSRAAWAIDLARAGAIGLPCDANATFWRMLDSWMHDCPPFLGFQWKCGQEAATRLIAASLAFWSLSQSQRAAPERWLPFARLAWATGYRIAGHISYAISQGNNHALSEACGLLLVSHLFPEFREAERWGKLGRRVMETQLRRQFHSDGSYVQWSFNYQRVALQVSTLALRLAELGGRPFDRELYQRLGTSAPFLHQMMESRTGQLPNYGNNDGAWVLPLSECDVSDFRPAIQSAYFLAERKRLLPPGPWDEDLMWLFGPTALDHAVKGASSQVASPQQSVTLPVGGYHTLRRGQSWAMLRCHTYQSRPGQYDAMHLDLWWKGLNLLQDTGTFQYYVPGREDIAEYFGASRAHNTVQLDGADPCEWASRFLHVPWSRARVRRFDAAGDGPWCIEAERYDYDRSPWRVLHRRTILSLPADVWVVVDDLLGSGKHRAVVYWHLPDLSVQSDEHRRCVCMSTREGDFSVHVSLSSGRLNRFEVIRGRDEVGHVQGFASPNYGMRIPSPVIVAETEGSLPLRIVTVAGPGPGAFTECGRDDGWEERWSITAGGTTHRIRLALPTRSSPRTFLGLESE